MNLIAAASFVVSGTFLVYFLKKLDCKMAKTFEELKAQVTAVSSSLSDIDVKLDAVKEKIDALEAGTVLGQAQIDELSASFGDLEVLGQKVKVETESLVKAKEEVVLPGEP